MIIYGFPTEYSQSFVLRMRLILILILHLLLNLTIHFFGMCYLFSIFECLPPTNKKEHWCGKKVQSAIQSSTGIGVSYIMRQVIKTPNCTDWGEQKRPLFTYAQFFNFRPSVLSDTIIHGMNSHCMKWLEPEQRLITQDM